MLSARQIYKTLSVFSVLLLCTLIVLLIYPINIVYPHIYIDLRLRLSQIGYSLISSVVGIKIITYGSPPDRPFVLVSNHLSYLDIPLLGSLSEGVFLSKQEIRNTPLIGFVSDIFGNIFIDRTSRSDIEEASHQIAKRYSQGEGITIFPEGTTSDGTSVGDFSSSIFYYISSNQISVNYAAIKYETCSGYASANETVCWHHQMSFLEYLLNLLDMPQIKAHVMFGDDEINYSDRKTMSKELESRVSDSFRSIH